MAPAAEVLWTVDDINELLHAMMKTIGRKERNKIWNVGLKALDWRDVAFGDFSSENCRDKWQEIMQKLRKIKTLIELIVDAQFAIENSQIKLDPKMEFPKKPVSANALYFAENKSLLKERNPKMNSRELMKFANDCYKKLPPENKVKYVQKVQKAKREYQGKICVLNEEKKRKRTEPDEERDSQRSNISKKPQQEEHVKRPLNGYNLFCHDQKALVSGVPQREIPSVWSQRWKELSPEEKKNYSVRCLEMKPKAQRNMTNTGTKMKPKAQRDMTNTGTKMKPKAQQDMTNTGTKMKPKAQRDMTNTGTKMKPKAQRDMTNTGTKMKPKAQRDMTNTGTKMKPKAQRDMTNTGTKMKPKAQRDMTNTGTKMKPKAQRDMTNTGTKMKPKAQRDMTNTGTKMKPKAQRDMTNTGTKMKPKAQRDMTNTGTKESEKPKRSFPGEPEMPTRSKHRSVRDRDLGAYREQLQIWFETLTSVQKQEYCEQNPSKRKYLKMTESTRAVHQTSDSEDENLEKSDCSNFDDIVEVIIEDGEEEIIMFEMF